MSRESAAAPTTAAAGGGGGGPASSVTTIKTHDASSKQGEEHNAHGQQNGFEGDDDSDFVLVVNRKKHATIADPHHHQHHQNSRHHQYHKGNSNHSSYHRQQPQSQYTDGGGGGGDENDPGPPSHGSRRRRYKEHNNQQQRRDNSTGSKPFRGRGTMRQRDRGHNNHQSQHDNYNKENAGDGHVHHASASTDNNSKVTDKTGNNKGSPASSSAVNQPLPTPPAPVMKTFSLVVAAGSSASGPPSSSSAAAPLLQRLYSPAIPPQQQKHSLPAPQQVLSTTVAGYSPQTTQRPPIPILLDNTNDQTNSGQVTNRQLLVVDKLGATDQQQQQQPEGASAPSSVVTERSSSIPDTSSLTSEETIDSCSGISKSDNQVEFVEAPVPKVNPWVANRNAAQVIVKKPSLVEFPSVNESFPDTLGSPTSPSPSPAVAAPPNKSQAKKVTNPAPPQANSNNKQQTVPRNETTNAKKSSSQPAQQQIVSNPSISSTLSSSPIMPNVGKRSSASVGPCSNGQSTNNKTKATQKPTQNLEEKEDASNNELAPAPPAHYVREMANVSFYSGRGRGSFPKKVHSRSEVLKKVVGENVDNNSSRSLPLPPISNDWPTLRETVEKVPLTVARLKSVGSEDSSGGGEVERSCVDPAKLTDVVDCSQPLIKSHSATLSTGNKDNQPSTQQHTPSRSASSSSNETGSDNEDQQDDNGTGKNGNRRPSKQKWLPLDLTEEHQPEGKTKPSGKAGRGKVGGGYSSISSSYQNYYQPQNYYPPGGRGKGKENMINGHSDYMETERGYPRYGPYSSRGMRGSSRGGSRNHGGRKQNGGGNHNNYPQRSGPAFNGHTVMNGHRAPHRLELISATTAASLSLVPQVAAEGGGFVDYPIDYSTLTTMYPTVGTEFLMPYIPHGYFATPFSPAPPAGTGVVAAGVPAAATTTGVVQQPALQQSRVAQVQYGPLNDVEGVTKQVQKQIEYYFSEVNLEKDFYLRRRMDEEGFIPIYILSSFPRVKSMTEEYSVVVSAIQSSEELELNEDSTSVRTKISPEKWPIFDSENTILANPHPAPHDAPHNDICNPDDLFEPRLSSMSSSSASKSAESSSASSSSSSSSSHTINDNNNHQHSSNYHALSATVAETLNPNVPEFVPKSKVALY